MTPEQRLCALLHAAEMRAEDETGGRLAIMRAADGWLALLGNEIVGRANSLEEALEGFCVINVTAFGRAQKGQAMEATQPKRRTGWHDLSRKHEWKEFDKERADEILWRWRERQRILKGEGRIQRTVLSLAA